VRTLIASERDAMLAEAKPPARLYGAIGAPTSQAELDTLFEAMKPMLAASPVVFEFLEIMTQVSGLPAAARDGPAGRYRLAGGTDPTPPPDQRASSRK
jgi:uncharacterized protein (DUF2236 family)